MLFDESSENSVLYSLGLYSLGLYSLGLYSLGLYSLGLYSFGLYSFGLLGRGALVRPRRPACPFTYNAGRAPNKCRVNKRCRFYETVGCAPLGSLPTPYRKAS